MENKAYAVPNPLTPCQAIIIDPNLCCGCNACVNVCRVDVLLPNPSDSEEAEEDGGQASSSGKPPLVVYPDECWFCGVCVEHCPVPGAIRMEHPLNLRIGWKRKETGEYFRIGMKNPPPPNTKPPIM